MSLTTLIKVAGEAEASTTGTTGTPQPGGLASTLITFGPFVLIIVLMYFLMIRPQKKKQKEEQQMRNNLRIGDELITIGGICGRVVSIKDDTVTIESGADRTKLQFLKSAIQTVNTKHDAPADDDDDDDDDDI